MANFFNINTVIREFGQEKENLDFIWTEQKVMENSSIKQRKERKGKEQDE